MLILTSAAGGLCSPPERPIGVGLFTLFYLPGLLWPLSHSLCCPWTAALGSRDREVSALVFCHLFFHVYGKSASCLTLLLVTCCSPIYNILETR